MRNIAMAAAFGALVLACSSSSEDAPNEAGWTIATPTSGTRLRAKVLVGGGARELVSFFDSARNEDCTFQEVTGGRVFCLPNAVPAVSGGALFADAACKESVVNVTSCAADAKYAVVISNGGCEQSIASIRPVTGPATTIYFQNGGGNCAPQASTPAQGTSFIALGDPVGFDQFVEGTITTEEKNGVTQRVAVSSDGARQPLGYRNAGLDVECTFQVMSDGVTRCAPRAGTATLLYSDSECTKATGAISTNSSGSCQTGAIVRDVDSTSGCTRTFFEVGPGTSSIDVEAGYTGSSSPSGSSCSSLFRTSSAIPIKDVTSSLVKISRIGSGSGRLVPALVSGTSADALVPGWHDNERNIDCQFAKASDGKVRCLPSGAPSLVFWTDTACKAPTRLAAPTGQRGCVPSGARFARATASGCSTGTTVPRRLDDTTRVYALSGDVKTVGASSVETSPGRCVTVAGIVGALDATEVNPADFVEATVATE